MKEVLVLLWMAYATFMTIYGWFTHVSSLEDFLMSLITWWILMAIPYIFYRP